MPCREPDRERMQDGSLHNLHCKMMVKKIRFVTLLTVVLAVACSKDGSEKEALSAYALDVYWAGDYSGPLGIQVGTESVGGVQQPRMYIAGKTLYVTGMNCYNLFVQCHESDAMAIENMRRTVKTLEKEDVPVVRFSCSPYYARQFTYYFDRKEKYLSNLDSLATWCDQAHIALIPSVFWNTSSVPEYFSEPADAWGDVSSKTYSHMLKYAEDVVNVLKSHKSVVMWEFGNEFNLGADIGVSGYPQVSADAVSIAYKGFAELVKKIDPHGRVVASGNSIMRNAQYHLYTEKNWNTDSFKQYETITEIMTPYPMEGMSEHIYEDVRSFSDKGNVSRSDQVYYAQQVAAALGKVYYVGEFTGPKTASGDSLMVRKHLIAYFAQRVQLSLMWNYALKGDIEYSFKADTPYGNMAFNLMREYNEKFRTVTE